MGEKKNKTKKILLFGAIAIVLIVIIVILIVFLVNRGGGGGPEDDGLESITLDDFLEGKLYAKGFGADWVSNEEILYRNISNGEVLLHNVITDEKIVLIRNDDEKVSSGVEFHLSPDKKFVLVATEYIRLFRNSFHAKYFVFDLTTRTAQQVTVNGQEVPLLLAKWNPVTNGIVFNYNSDLYYKQTPSSPEIRLTNDGRLPPEFSLISNGVPDWVYEEEVLSSNSATWFSTDGRVLTFLKFDDSSVRDIQLPVYGQPGDLNWQYTRQRILLYPKPGTPNPTVTLHYVELDKLQPGEAVVVEKINPPPPFDTIEHIISVVSWVNDNKLISVWMNRVQNEAIMQSCGITQKLCAGIIPIKSSTGWIDFFTAPLYDSTGNKMIFISSQPQGEAGAFRHIFYVEEVGTPVAITSGKFVVLEILKWHKASNRIFFSANLENDPGAKHIFTMKPNVGQTPECITCKLGEELNQSYFEAEFSTDGDNFILSAKGPNIPQDFLYTWKEVGSVFEATKLRVWEENTELTETLKKKAVPLTEYHEIDLGNGFTSRVKLQLPRRLDRSGTTKYPVLIDVYAGPESFTTDNRFSINWGSHLASNKSYIYAKIDGRGSGMRGDKILHQIYRRLGTVEIEDQITTAK